MNPFSIFKIFSPKKANIDKKNVDLPAAAADSLMLYVKDIINREDLASVCFESYKNLKKLLLIQSGSSI